MMPLRSVTLKALEPNPEFPLPETEHWPLYPRSRSCVFSGVFFCPGCLVKGTMTLGSDGDPCNGGTWFGMNLYSKYRVEKDLLGPCFPHDIWPALIPHILQRIGQATNDMGQFTEAVQGHALKQAVEEFEQEFLKKPDQEVLPFAFVFFTLQRRFGKLPIIWNSDPQLT